MTSTARQRNRARCEIVAAALLWSLSSVFTKSLTNSTFLHVDEPRLAPMSIAALRAFFAGLAMVPFLRRGQRPPVERTLVTMMICFAVMNALFITAMTTGAAAVAILLQYTAPVWLLVIGVFWLGEKLDRQDLLLLVGGMTGMGVIIAGNWTSSSPLAIWCALGSGATYASIVLFLRVLRERSAVWLTACNLLGTAVALGPLLALSELPTMRQLGWLALFGSVQLALPYWLMARGLRHVPSFEAGLLTLLEPVLNPLWAWLIAPDTERPTTGTLIGGGMILAALAIRYWPRGVQRPAGQDS